LLIAVFSRDIENAFELFHISLLSLSPFPDFSAVNRDVLKE